MSSSLPNWQLLIVETTRKISLVVVLTKIYCWIDNKSFRPLAECAVWFQLHAISLAEQLWEHSSSHQSSLFRLLTCTLHTVAFACISFNFQFNVQPEQKNSVNSTSCCPAVKLADACWTCVSVWTNRNTVPSSSSNLFIHPSFIISLSECYCYHNRHKTHGQGIPTVPPAAAAAARLYPTPL